MQMHILSQGGNGAQAQRRQPETFWKPQSTNTLQILHAIPSPLRPLRHRNATRPNSRHARSLETDDNVGGDDADANVDDDTVTGSNTSDEWSREPTRDTAR